MNRQRKQAAAELLKEARSRLVLGGLLKLGMGGVRQIGYSCTMLAPPHVKGESSVYSYQTVTQDAQAALARAYGGPFTPATDVYAWNDRPETTLDDVLALYDKAIRRLEVPWYKRIFGVEVGKPEKEVQIEPTEVPWEEPLTVPDFKPVETPIPDPETEPVKEPVKV